MYYVVQFGFSCLTVCSSLIKLAISFITFFLELFVFLFYFV